MMICIFLFAYGPWPWPIEGNGVYFYLISAMVFFGIMYSAAVIFFRPNRNFCHHTALCCGIRAQKYSLIATAIFLWPTFVSKTGSVIPHLIFGISEIGKTYSENMQRLSSNNELIIVEYLRIILSTLLVAFVPLTVFYWRKLSTKVKWLSFACIVLTVLIGVESGTNKMQADMLIFVSVSFFSSWAVNRFPIRWGRIFWIALLLLIGFATFFTVGQVERPGGLATDSVMPIGNGDLIYADSTQLSFLPKGALIFYESFSRYLTQGFYALSLSLDLNSPDTYGIGNSVFLSRTADKIIGSDYFTSSSMPLIIEQYYGYDAFTNWHSLFVWLISDFGVFGSVIFFGMLAYILSRCWNGVLHCADWSLVVLLNLLFIIIFYLPANNQVMQYPEYCFAFICLLFIRLYSAVVYTFRGRHAQ